MLSTSTKENFSEFQERLRRLPVKDNEEVFNTIYNEIMKIIKSHHTRPKEAKKEPIVETKEKNIFNERKALIDKNVQDETNKWNIIDLLESLIITNNQIYISSYELYDYISKRGNLSKESAFSLISFLDKDKDGYEGVNLKIGGKSYRKKVHRLVAEAFIDNPNNYPCIDHINGIRDDNRVENLRYCTVKMNANYELAKKNRSLAIKQSYVNNPNLREIRANTFGKSNMQRIEVFQNDI